jgi:hypothetical protein
LESFYISVNANLNYIGYICFHVHGVGIIEYCWKNSFDQGNIRITNYVSFEFYCIIYVHA